jgi:hypothetical protein
MFTDSSVEEAKFEPLARRTDSPGTRLLTFDHKELIGRGEPRSGVVPEIWGIDLEDDRPTAQAVSIPDPKKPS